MRFPLRPLAGCRYGLLFLLLALLPAGLRAQSGCLLVPVPLAQRVQQATLVVEAQVVSQQAEEASGGHLVTRHTLAVYKVFRGQLPAGALSLRTAGGTLGTRRETATSTLELAVGTQGVFFLEADPLAAPGEWRAYAGPQGLLRYDLRDLSASDPFAHYPTIGADVQQRVAALAGQPYREVAPNQVLAQAADQPAQRQRGTAQKVLATPTISSFAPTTLIAGANGSSSLLTITGTGFNATQGTGYVEFRNADNPGTTASPTYTQPLASNYVSWSDTQIQVWVPSSSASGNAAGTGLVRVTNSDANTATSTATLTVTYALSNVSYPNTTVQTYRVHLFNTDTHGGYTLYYTGSFPTVAQMPFATAVQSWRCATSMNRTIGGTTTATDQVSSADGINEVRFAGNIELPTGVLAVTNSYYGGCSNPGGSDIVNWLLTGTDYSFAPIPYPNYNWNYTTNATANNEFDFQSVALHELGHGEQLTHIIFTPGVMNYSISNGSDKRTLDAATDIAGGNDVIGYSTSATSDELCNQNAFTTSACPLPVQLTAFTARYQASEGTRLAWATASEQQSAAFVVESQDETTSSLWREVVRVAAAGSSLTPRQYAARDPRPLAGIRYYRLRQVDQDGSVAYSPTVVVSASASALSAYPNPATATVTLSGPLAAGTAA